MEVVRHNDESVDVDIRKVPRNVDPMCSDGAPGPTQQYASILDSPEQTSHSKGADCNEVATCIRIVDFREADGTAIWVIAKDFGYHTVIIS